MTRPALAIVTPHNPYSITERTPLTPRGQRRPSEDGRAHSIWKYARYATLSIHALLWAATLSISAAVRPHSLAAIIPSALGLAFSMVYSATVIRNRSTDSAANRVVVEVAYHVCHAALLLVIGSITVADRSLCMSPSGSFPASGLCVASAVPILAFSHLTLVTCWLALVLYLAFAHSTSSPHGIPKIYLNVWNLLGGEHDYTRMGQVDGVSVEKWWDQIPTVQERRASMSVEEAGSLREPREVRLSTSSWHTVDFDYGRRSSGERRWGDSYVGVESRRNSYSLGEQGGETGYIRIKSWGGQSHTETGSAHRECEEGDISQGARLLGEKSKGHEARVSLVSTSSSSSDETVRQPIEAKQSSGPGISPDWSEASHYSQ
ncbi:hypothetical protein L202_06939 [Cryptococcus amylolentus CBS 6039]|uniref:Uncharacterized protein n=1 Tax=Cryptococcus amylolentus CBS 6039 TaxID=1295533 RepID=A0A1E3HE16_9TREE|nr:hypothetical protein L202_06939 [Cryptococcus amylolentus CBS 6039]ODN74577.1 hypothetical protein L202_06939 [Cryptococcus amylolentus CBS 6039]